MSGIRPFLPLNRLRPQPTARPAAVRLERHFPGSFSSVSVVVPLSDAHGGFGQECCRMHRSAGKWSEDKSRTPNLRMFNLWLSCVVFILAGCSRSEPVQDAAASAPSSTIEAETPGPNLAVAADPVPDRGPPAPSPAVLIVAAGTAETVELWSEAIKTQLGHIASAFAKTDAVEGGAPAPLADRIEMIDTDVFRAKELYNGQPVKVVEVSPPGALMPRRRCAVLTLARGCFPRA